MKHRVKVTVLDKKLFPELQQQFCANPSSGACSCYNVGDEFIFERAEDTPLFRGLGRHLPVYLHRPAGWVDYEGLDEPGKHHDHLLQRRDKAGYL